MDSNTSSSDVGSSTVNEELKKQNELLAEQNALLRELIDRTPDRNMVSEAFSKQQKQMDILTKDQKVQSAWSWIQFALLIAVVIVVIVLLIKAWLFFRSVTNTFSQYFEVINSSFGKMESAFSDIKGFFENLGKMFKF